VWIAQPPGRLVIAGMYPGAGKRRGDGIDMQTPIDRWQ